MENEPLVIVLVVFAGSWIINSIIERKSRYGWRKPSASVENKNTVIVKGSTTQLQASDTHNGMITDWSRVGYDTWKITTSEGAANAVANQINDWDGHTDK